MRARRIPTPVLLSLLSQVVARGGKLEVCVHGPSMAPTISDGDSVLLGPVRGAVGAVVMAPLGDGTGVHRIAQLVGGRALLSADACWRQDWVHVEDLVAEVYAVKRRRAWPARLRALCSAVVRRAGLLALLAAGGWTAQARAQCTVTPYIVVDGKSCDWTAAQKPLTYASNDTTDPFGNLDLDQTLLTDNFNTASIGKGNLYGLMTFATGTTFHHDSQVGLFLNIAGGPAPDPACNANYAVTFQCVAANCAAAADWTATFFSNLSGTACQTAQTAKNLTLTGANQQAAFAINGSIIEFGVNFGAIGLPTTFLATPFSTPDRHNNNPLDQLAQRAYNATTVGPNAARVSAVAAHADGKGVTVGWTTQGEAGNLGFSVWRERDGHWTRASAQAIPSAGDGFSPHAYRFFDPNGRAGDRYSVSDIDRRTARTRTWGGALASATAVLPDVSALPHRQRAPSERREDFRAQAPQMRLGVTAEGMYRVDGAARGSKLSFFGEPVHLEAATGGALFYAPAVRNAYDGVNAYVLEPGDGSEGDPRASSAQSGPFVSTVRSREHLKQFLAYDWYIGGDDPYVWAWSTNLYPVDPVLFDAPGAAPGGDATLVAHLIGGTAFAHHVQVQLNGATLGDVQWTGTDAVPFEVHVPPGVLAQANSLSVVSVFDTGAPYEFVLLDSIDLAYDRGLAAVAGEARFEVPAGHCARATGFGAGAAAWDVTSPRGAHPVDVPAIDGALTVCAGEQPRWFEVFDASAVRVPSVRPLQRAALRQRDIEADEVILAHPSLVEAAQPLAEARRAQGLTVKVVGLTSVYDTFGDGNEGRQPIREFLRYAHAHWRRPPRYVLLLGGANADLRDVLNTGVPNLLPSGVALAGPDAMRAASDSWYVAREDGVTPFAAIGRLPVDTPADAAGVISKVLAADVQGPPTRGALVATDVSLQSDDSNFALASQVIGNLLAGSGVQSASVSAGDPAAAAKVASSLSYGTDLWHYVGHAGTSAWGEQQWLDAAQVKALQNGRFPLLTSYDCLDGMFDNPVSVTLGWAAVANLQGGASASFVPSTVLSPREGHFFDALVTQSLAPRLGGPRRLGDALLPALQLAAHQVGLQDYVRTYNLLGDPASPAPW